MIIPKPQLVENIVRELSDNSTGQISPYDIRHNLLDIIDSVHLLTGSQNLRARNFDTTESRTTRAGDFTLDKLGLEGYFSVDNSAFGYSALTANYQGAKNTAIGSYALSCNIYGEDNAALGYHALAGNTNGFGNVGVGSFALNNNKIGNFNIAIGHAAGYYVDRDTSNRLFIASHPIDEAFLCANETGDGLVPLIHGDLSSANLRVGIAARNLHEGATLQVGGHIHPTISGLSNFDIGSSLYRWGNLYLTSVISFPNNNYITYSSNTNRFAISSHTTIHGSSTIGGNVVISGALSATGSASFGGSLSVGNDVSISGGIDASGSIVPVADKAFNLGDFDKRWLNAYVNNIYVAGVGRFNRFEAVEQAHYLHKTMYLASSGYVDTIDGGGPNGLYDRYTPNAETDEPQGYLIDEELSGAGLNIKSKGVDYSRTYSFNFKSIDWSLKNLSFDDVYSRSSWNSNISIHTGSGCHVKTDRVIHPSSVAIITYNDGLGLHVKNGKMYNANQHNVNRNLAGLSNVNYISHSGELGNYAITISSPNSGVNLSQRFLSNVANRTLDSNNNELLKGFECIYINDSELNAPSFFNADAGQYPSRFVIRSFNNSATAKRAFTLLQDSADGFVGISNFEYSDYLLPDTILNIRSTGDAVTRITAENDGYTKSAVQLLGVENCLTYGTELEYVNLSGIFNINMFDDEKRTNVLRVLNTKQAGLFAGSGNINSMFTIGDINNPNASVAMYESSDNPVAASGYGKIFVKKIVDGDGKHSSLQFMDSSGNMFDVIMNAVSVGGLSLDKPLFVDDLGNTFGGRFSPEQKQNIVQAQRNTAIGFKSLMKITDGDNNTVVGYQAGSGITTGSHNVVLGYNCLQSVNTGSNNIIIGNNLGNDIANNASNVFMLGYQGKVLMSGDISAQRLNMPNGTLMVDNLIGDSLSIKSDSIEVIDRGGGNYPDNTLTFRFTGNQTANMLVLNHNANPIVKNPEYQNPSTPRPRAELNADLRLLGAVRFSDKTSLESASFLNNIQSLETGLSATNTILNNTSTSLNNLRTEYNNLIIEGYAVENINAPTNAANATTGRIRPKVKIGDAWQDKPFNQGESGTITIHNRDTRLRIAKQDYVIAIKVNGEYRPLWVSYGS